MPPDPDSPTILTTARTDFEARTIAFTLKEAGIEASVFSAAANMLQWEAGYTDPIKVVVRRRDFDRAREILHDAPRAARGIDWSSVDVGSPEPGTDLGPELSPAQRHRRRIVKLRLRRSGWIMASALTMSSWLGPAALGPVFAAAGVLIALSWNDDAG